MTELATPPEVTESVLNPVRESAVVLERIANGVLFFAVLTGVGSLFGGCVAIFHGDGNSHPFLGQGLAWVVGGGLIALTVAMFAVWAKTYAAVVKQSTQD